MNYLAVCCLALLTSTEGVFACPAFSGEYRFADRPWNGLIQVEQNGCTSVIITRTRKVDVSARYPDGIWTDVRVLKIDNQPYVGFSDSTQPASLESKTFQKVSWVNQRLVFRQYVGSQKRCEGKYFLNQSDCHVTEYSLHREDRTFVWMQKGVWWDEDGRFISDRYVLVPTGRSSSMATRVAQN